VQIGAAGMADRYTYFPSIGLFLAIVWGVADLIPARVAAIAGGIVVAIFAAMAHVQVSYWKNTETLFEHTLAVTGPNPIAEYVLGQSLQTEQPDRAIPHLRRAIELTEASLRVTPNSPKPDLYAQSHVGIGTALLTKAKSASEGQEKSKLIDDAASEYEAALRIDPNAGNAQRNLALARSMQTTVAQSAKAQVDRFIDAGVALSQHKKLDEAIAEFRKAVGADPSSLEAHVYLGIGLAQGRQNAEAASELRKAQRIDAARANRFVTGILRLPQSATNLDRLVQQLQSR